ncbi:hypothetical protein [Fonticella tunisiensis]|uniref:Uncharacterized protein n=1 Tax=Fonticella tunisiensis TaxID=1096341 RepID=A0A4R7KSI5_9CLOT|nr:hypothetical protein [Fonticella tunisiensis]TDT62767.1 hypothetical protein EDD71_10340 [Fonticella tunisiensis]
MALSDFLKRLFNKEESSDNLKEQTVEKVTYEIDEEDKIVVALVASIMAGKDKPNSHFHISRITRVK